MNTCSDNLSLREWQEMTYFRLAGEFISNYAKIENYMLQICAIHLVSNLNDRHKVMKSILSKFHTETAIRLFSTTMNLEHKQFLDKHKNLIDQIENLKEDRNMLSHSHLSDNPIEINKMGKSKFSLEYLRPLPTDKDRPRGDGFYKVYVEISKFEDKILEIKKMADFMNRFRSHIKDKSKEEPDSSFRPKKLTKLASSQ